MDFWLNLPFLLLLLTTEYNSLQLKDCSKFLNCAHNKAYVISCSTGTLFNPRTSSCDFEKKIQCVMKTAPVVTAKKIPHENIWKSTTTPNPLNKKIGLWEGVGRVVGGVINVANAFKSEIKNATMKITRKLIKNKDEAANSFKNEIMNVRTKIKRKFIKNKDEVLAKTGWNFSSKDKDATLLCLKPKGQFPYPKDCSKFINCWQGKPSLMVCPDDLVFDASTHSCGWPRQAVCTLPSVFNDPKKKSGKSLLTLTPFSGQDIRLRRGGAPYVGYLQVWFKDNWRPVVVLEDHWNAKDDICLSLGFSRGAHSETRGLVYGWSENDAGQKALICNSTTLDPFKCPFQDVTAEFISKSVVGIRCRKNSVSECPPKWHRWGKKCYFVDIRIKKGRKEAKDICEKKNGRLLSITNQAENDFVSYLLASMGGSSEVFYSGGSTFYLHDERYWLWEGTNQPLSKNFGFQKWWLGWDNKTENLFQPELEKKKSLCICLRDTFPLNKSSGYQRNNAKYFFWELCDCVTRLSFVCEMEPLEIGCITGRGENYDGKANITMSGTPCLYWKTLGATYKGLSKITTLRENFCSNPDGDDLPWCYVTKNKLEFCDIPRCPFHEPIKIERANSTCSSGSYTCTDGKCIHLEWVCDGQKDCSQGEEEEDCPDYSHVFRKHSGFALSGSEVEKWLFSPKTTCAIRCMQAKNFLCHSFNYHESTSTCVLSKSTGGKSGGLAKNSSWEYHERVDLAPNCSNTFLCSDFKCLPRDQVCDGRRHCVEGEDEKDCFESGDFLLRLINGSQPHEGRIEVKVFDEWQPICDDMWGIEDGNVACKELGFKRGAKKTYTNSYFGSGLMDFVMDDMNCNGDETSLALCNFGGWSEHDCSKNEAASVVCNLDSEECSEAEWECANGRCIAFAYYCDHIDDCGDGSDEAQDRCLSPVELRLGSDIRMSSEGLREGRVELKYKGIWGTVCDDDITLSEGHVLCRMLGMEGALSIFKNGTFGPGDGPIWIDGLQCRGHENDVTECHHDPWGLTNCNHSEDVGVQCTERLDTSLDDIIELNPLPMEATPGILLPTCGVRYVEDSPKALLSSPRVVDGHIPRMGANPWMAGLRRRTSFGSTHECGAFILTEDLLMTAAHCIWKYPMAQYLVRTGDYNNEEKDPFEEEWALEEIWEHPRFDKGVLFNNDIAIIRIKRKAQQGIQFNEQVQPICLVGQEFEYTSGLNCTVAGWGTLGHSSGYSRILQSSLLPLLPDSVCREDYVYGATRISSGMFCAGYLEGGIDTCQGDSGGPLVCQFKDRFTAVGITSWGHGCARANKPGVYTKLTHYLDWIYNTTQELKS